eukprot:GHVT01045306.1.p3 GENE.GHVT01045306.1~~GHVT01045306.1.p3  ORF type:complete len:104 (-),score=17.39 GHVT01045306.1:202-513(-)
MGMAGGRLRAPGQSVKSEESYHDEERRRGPSFKSFQSESSVAPTKSLQAPVAVPAQPQAAPATEYPPPARPPLGEVATTASLRNSSPLSGDGVTGAVSTKTNI